MKRGLLAAVAVFFAVAGSSGAGALGAAPVRDSYIVVFKTGAVPDVPAAAQALASANGGAITFVYRHALEGFAVQLPAGRANALADDPRVAYVEPDELVEAVATQSPATWGLDRIDQRSLPLNSTYNYN